MMGIDVDAVLRPSGNLLSSLITVQKATANNMANINTPGYKAKHPSFASMLEQHNSPFETSLSIDMGESMAPELMNPAARQVNLQQEMVDMQNTMMRFGIATTHLGKVFTRLKEFAQVGR